MDALIKHTLQQIPGKRFSSARELAGALEALVRESDEEAGRKEQEATEAELRKQREAEEAVKRQAEAEARRQAKEEELRKAREDARRNVEEAKAQAEKMAIKRAENAVRMKAEAEARRQAEEEAKRKAEEEARVKAEAEARRREEVEAKRKAADEARRRQLEAERLEDEKFARRKAEAESGRRKMLFAAAGVVLAMLAFFVWNAFEKSVDVPQTVDEPKITSPPAKKFALTIRTEPSDAQVSFVGSSMTYRPGMELAPGTYPIRVSREGFVARSYDVPITDSDIVTDARLEKEATLPAEYSLTIRPTPADALVKIKNIKPKYQDGIKVGPGQYKIEVSKAGYKTFVGTVDVKDRDVVATAELEKEPEVASAPVEASAPVSPQPAPAPAAPSHPASPSRGDTWRDPVTGMEFVWVPEGCYQMGSNGGYSDEYPMHEVCVDGFWMGRYEVTQAEWQRVMGSNPSYFKGDRNPVEQVSWNDAQDFIRKLNASGSGRFRLPTEAEWEYAARSGGRDEKYAGGNDVDRVAWYDGNSGGRTHPVGTKAPNGLGLYDMSGNVYEWCQDVWDSSAYSKHSRNNPVISGGGSDRVLRGGSWSFSQRYVRAAIRIYDAPDSRGSSQGFRLLRTD